MDSIKRTHDSITVLGMRVDMVQIPYVIAKIQGWIDSKDCGHYVVVSNANDAILCKKDPNIKNTVNVSSLSVPDGISLVILSRLRGYNLKKRVYGPDLMFEFLKATESKGYFHFFYGSTEDTLKSLVANLKKEFPNIRISGVYAPPFRPLTDKEEAQLSEMVNNLKPDVIWVGLGCPKQQIWMHCHKDKFKVPVMVGAGAAFDFFAKTKPQAPRWLRDHGFEWLFRLLTEPRRLWKRYLVNGSLFFLYALKESLMLLFCKNKKIDV